MGRDQSKPLISGAYLNHPSQMSATRGVVLRPISGLALLSQVIDLLSLSATFPGCATGQSGSAAVTIPRSPRLFGFIVETITNKHQKHYDC